MPARRERRRPRSDLPPRPPRCALRARRVATTTPAVSRPEVGEAATSSVTAVSTAMMLGGLCEGRVRHTRRHPAALTSTECRSRPPLRRRGPPRRLHLRSRMEHRLAATIWGYKILTAAWCLSEEVHDHQVEYLCTRLHRTKSTKAISGGKILQREVLAHNNIAVFSEQTDHPIYSEDKRTTLQERSEILEAPQRAATDKVAKKTHIQYKRKKLQFPNSGCTTANCNRQGVEDQTLPAATPKAEIGDRRAGARCGCSVRATEGEGGGRNGGWRAESGGSRAEGRSLTGRLVEDGGRYVGRRRRSGMGECPPVGCCGDRCELARGGVMKRG